MNLDEVEALRDKWLKADAENAKLREQTKNEAIAYKVLARDYEAMKLQIEGFQKDCDCGDKNCCLRERQGRRGVIEKPVGEVRLCLECGDPRPCSKHDATLKRKCETCGGFGMPLSSKPSWTKCPECHV